MIVSSSEEVFVDTVADAWIQLTYFCLFGIFKQIKVILIIFMEERKS